MIHRIISFELWGNARDGFNNNMNYLQNTLDGEFTDRQLLKHVRDVFEGRSFAWTENKTTFMTRRGITVQDYGSDGFTDILYHGHTIGEVQSGEGY